MPMTKEDRVQRERFAEYCYDFYGTRGIYPMGATMKDIRKATTILVHRFRGTVDFDSVDRERVRDILIDEFGYTWPE